MCLGTIYTEEHNCVLCRSGDRRITRQLLNSGRVSCNCDMSAADGVTAHELLLRSSQQRLLALDLRDNEEQLSLEEGSTPPPTPPLSTPTTPPPLYTDRYTRARQTKN